MPCATLKAPDADNSKPRSTRHSCMKNAIRQTPPTESHEARSQLQWTAQKSCSLLRQLEARLSTLRRLDSEKNARSMPLGTLKRPTSQDKTSYEGKRPRLTYSLKRAKVKGAGQWSRTSTSQQTMRVLSDMKACRFRSSADTAQSWVMSGRDNVQRRSSGKERDYDTLQSPNGPIQDILNDVESLHEGSGRRRHAYKGIMDWLNEFLQATKFGAADSHPNSLLAMCLRKIPACVDDIEAWEEERAQHQANLCSSTLPDILLEIYEQLEAFGDTMVGWQPLKHAVRAHGICVLKKAVSAGLFDLTFVKLLVRLCAQHGCLDEAAHLATAVPGRLPPPRNLYSPIDESSKLQPLGALIATSIYNNGRGQGAAFRSILGLIKEKRLPCSWITTEVFLPVLLSAIEAINSRNCSSDATKLLTTTLKALAIQECKKPVGRQQQVVVTVAAELVTAITVTTFGPVTEVQRRSQRRLRNALDGCLQAARERKGDEDGFFFVLCLARLLASGGTKSETATLREYLKQSIQETENPGGRDRCFLRHKYIQTLALVYAVVIARSRERLKPDLQDFTTINRQLAGLQLPCWFLHRLKRDCRVLLEQRTVEGRDPDVDKRSAWLWEEGLEEWVLRNSGSQGISLDVKQLDPWADKVTGQTRNQKSHLRQTNTKAGRIDSEQGSPASPDPDCGRSISASGNRTALGYKIGGTTSTGKPARTTELSEVDEDRDCVSGNGPTTATHELQRRDRGQKQGRGADVAGCSDSSGKEGQLKKRAKTGLLGGLTAARAVQAVRALPSESAEANLKAPEGKATRTTNKSAAAAPIGGRRQLFIVRGQQVRGAARGPSRPGHEADWSPW